MGDSTKISWTDATWNPIRGCSRVSEGCRNCYAETMAGRFCGPGQPYEGLAVRRLKVISDDKQRMEARWTGEVRFVAEHLADPLRWRKPRKIFVNSMSDLFHESLSNEQIAAVFGVMAASPQHTFQVLTKRARRMRKWFEWVAPGFHLGVEASSSASIDKCICVADDALSVHESANTLAHWFATGRCSRNWPLPNVWLGVSVENQAAADERIDQLRQIPAVVHFLSMEPLLERIRPDLTGIDWVIAGCESGPGARPCSVEWLRSLRDQCAAAEVPFFLKQAWETPFFDDREDPREVGYPSGSVTPPTPTPIAFGTDSKRKPRGILELPYLDGVQHAAFPEVRP